MKADQVAVRINVFLCNEKLEIIVELYFIDPTNDNPVSTMIQTWPSPWPQMSFYSNCTSRVQWFKQPSPGLQAIFKHRCLQVQRPLLYFIIHKKGNINVNNADYIQVYLFLQSFFSINQKVLRLYLWNITLKILRVTKRAIYQSGK